MYSALSHRAVCLGGLFLALASMGKAVMSPLKIIKKKRRYREIFIVEAHLEKDNSLVPHWAERGGRLPSSTLVFCQAGQDPYLAGYCTSARSWGARERTEGGKQNGRFHYSVQSGALKLSPKDDPAKNDMHVIAVHGAEIACSNTAFATPLCTNSGDYLGSNA